jgi:hypothetical protein
LTALGRYSPAPRQEGHEEGTAILLTEEWTMAKEAELSAAERIRLSGLGLHWPPGGGWATDPIDMDHIFQLDRDLAFKLTAIQLETRAQVLNVMANAFAETAKAFQSRG